MPVRKPKASPVHAYVGRQAIFDRDLEVAGYELLYRSGDGNRARFSDVDQATATTMLSTYLELGIDQLAGARPVFVNLPASFLLGEYPIVLPPERTVIEVLEDVPVTSALVAAIQALRTRGFTIALDDFELTDETRRLVPLADLIKLDVMLRDQDEIREHYHELRECPQLLAEKIETREMLDYVRDLGFDLFQGYFLEKPVVRQQQRMPHNRAALLRLLARLYDPKLDIRQVEKLLAAEVGLTVPILKLAQSAAFSSGGPVGTLGEAVARLGTQQVAAIVMLTLVANFDDKPLELARQALVRARMCELLARGSSVPPSELFTAGLISLLDAMVDVPLAELLDQIPVTATIRESLQATSSMPGRIVEAARGQSAADFRRVAATGLPPNALFVAWYEAIGWADQVISLLE